MVRSVIELERANSAVSKAASKAVPRRSRTPLRRSVSQVTQQSARSRPSPRRHTPPPAASDPRRRGRHREARPPERPAPPPRHPASRKSSTRRERTPHPRRDTRRACSDSRSRSAAPMLTARAVSRSRPPSRSAAHASEQRASRHSSANRREEPPLSQAATVDIQRAAAPGGTSPQEAPWPPGPFPTETNLLCTRAGCPRHREVSSTSFQVFSHCCEACSNGSRHHSRVCDFIWKWKKLDPKRNDQGTPMRWYSIQCHPSYGTGRLYCDLCGRWDENDHDKCEAHITQLKKVIQTGWTAEMKRRLMSGVRAGTLLSYPRPLQGQSPHPTHRQMIANRHTPPLKPGAAN